MKARNHCCQTNFDPFAPTYKFLWYWEMIKQFDTSEIVTSSNSCPRWIEMSSINVSFVCTLWPYTNYFLTQDTGECVCVCVCVCVCAYGNLHAKRTEKLVCQSPLMLDNDNYMYLVQDAHTIFPIRLVSVICLPLEVWNTIFSYAPVLT